MYSDPNHPERQQKEPHKWIKHQRDERHRPAKHKQHTPEEESYHRSSRALSDIKYVCLRARVPAIYAVKCFLRNSSVRAFASCQTGPSKPWPAPGEISIAKGIGFFTKTRCHGYSSSSGTVGSAPYSRTSS